ncbi:hypothetical protein ACXGQW_01525 [Wenyingzhuangia sp. IMCC45533]
MKNYIYIAIVSLFITSCTEEVFIDELLNAESRISIEANIDIDKNDVIASEKQSITLSKTADFYSQDYEPILGATIAVTDKDGNSLGTFLDDNPADTEDGIDGIYTALDFDAANIQVGEAYFLSVTIDGETYKAQDTYNSVVDIGEISSKEAEFIDDDAIEIRIDIENEIGIDNFFLIESKEIKKDPSISINLPDLDVFDDEFYSEIPGENIINIPGFVEEASTVQQIDFTLYGVSQKHYNFLNKILTQIDSGGGPFSTAPALIRGNIINETNQENFVLGYFSINQFTTKSFTIPE